MVAGASARSKTIAGPKAAVEEPVFRVDEVVDRFQRVLRAQERSPCTVKQYSHIARTFLGYVEKPLDEVASRDIERFREYLVLQRHYTKNSLYTTVRGLSCLFRTFGIN